jgi:DNA replication regulator DPB11
LNNDRLQSAPISAVLTEVPAEDEEEMALARRVPAITLQVWESLLKHRGFVNKGDALVRVDSQGNEALDKSILRGKASQVVKAKGIRSSQRVPSEAGPSELEMKARSALSTFSRTKSFTPARIESDSSKQPFRRTPSLFAPARNSPARDVAAVPMSTPQQLPDKPQSGIFLNMRFRARGEARTANVRSAVESGGGVWVEGGGDDQDVDIILVRLVRCDQHCWS